MPAPACRYRRLAGLHRRRFDSFDRALHGHRRPALPPVVRWAVAVRSNWNSARRATPAPSAAFWNLWSRLAGWAAGFVRMGRGRGLPRSWWAVSGRNTTREKKSFSAVGSSRIARRSWPPLRHPGRSPTAYILAQAEALYRSPKRPASSFVCSSPRGARRSVRRTAISGTTVGVERAQSRLTLPLRDREDGDLIRAHLDVVAVPQGAWPQPSVTIS